MTKKLNQNGLTAIEVLVSFVLVSIIVISMMNVVTNYKDREEQESYKTSITTYKNILTKTIYDDIIANNGVTSATKTDNSTDPNSEDINEKIELTYARNTKATITVYMKSKCITIKREKGTGKRIGEEEKNQTCDDTNKDNVDYENSDYHIEFTNSARKTEKFPLEKIYNLRYNDVKVESDMNTNFVVVHIGLLHTDLGQQYEALNIITPNVVHYAGVLGNA